MELPHYVYEYLEEQNDINIEKIYENDIRYFYLFLCLRFPNFQSISVSDISHLKPYDFWRFLTFLKEDEESKDVKFSTIRSFMQWLYLRGDIEIDVTCLIEPTEFE